VEAQALVAEEERENKVEENVKVERKRIEEE
jgi:uncharacterized protein YoaH (UPF0181 family)